LSTDELFPKDTTPFDPGQPDAHRVLFPEYLTCEDKSEQIAEHVIEWLTDPKKRNSRVEELRRLKAEVGHGGASRRAADYIVQVLGERPAREIFSHVHEETPATEGHAPLHPARHGIRPRRIRA